MGGRRSILLKRNAEKWPYFRAHPAHERGALVSIGALWRALDALVKAEASRFRRIGPAVRGGTPVAVTGHGQNSICSQVDASLCGVLAARNAERLRQRCRE